MAKDTKKGGVKLLGPLSTPDSPHSLGGQKVGGPTGGIAVPDPLGFDKTRRGGK